jgi:hypothetical protein
MKETLYAFPILNGTGMEHRRTEIFSISNQKPAGNVFAE